jgi:UDP:flavonoid glycosyltransferase YjiC (YdhE family)
LELPKLSKKIGPFALKNLHVPHTYTWSEALIPKPNDWGSHIDIVGFFFLDLASNYTPPPDLVKFLEQGPPPVYIGFGSIVVENPDGMTQLIFDAVSQAGVRAIVSKGWGGLGGDKLVVPENIYMIGNCPHDWLFLKVSAVVHHGGAGTTAAGLKAGKPTIVVPFFGDQPFCKFELYISFFFV